MKTRAGFSMMEILIAMVLLAAVGAVTIHSFTSAVQVTKSDSGVAYNFGRGIMERMYEYVRQDQWTTASLPLSTTTPGTAGAFQPQNSVKNLDGTDYRAVYTVTPIDADSTASPDDYRRVRMTICWDQPTCP